MNLLSGTEGGNLTTKNMSAYMCFGLLLLILAGCGELTQAGSPVEVTNLTLSETMAQRAEQTSVVPLVDQVEDAPDSTDSAPQALAFSEALETGEYVPVNVIAGASGAGLFSGPDEVYEQLKLLPSGTDAQATGEIDGDWAYIVHNGVEGWIESRRLTLHDLPERELEVQEQEHSGSTYVVGPVGVNIRTQPNADGTLLASASSGDQLHATGNTSRHWVEVTYQGVTGWASGNYINPV